MKRFWAFVLVFGLLFSLSGCGKKNDKGQNFTYDLSGRISSLDPQFSQSESGQIIIQNCFEGLLRFGTAGEVEKGAASHFSVSADGRTYEFTIDPAARWSDGSAVTADDFLFAFERLFSPTTPSPYAADFFCIENAAGVLSGELPLSSLGVRVGAGGRLIVTLSEANSFFPSLLTSSAAMPCKRSFFAEQRGRYGLSIGTLLTNGPFSVTRWDQKQVVLKAGEHYPNPTAVESVTLLFPAADTDTQARFRAGESDFFLGSGELDFGEGYNRQSFYDKTYLLVFNQRNATYGDTDIRMALISALDMSAIAEALGEGKAPADAILPPAASLFGMTYRDLAGSLTFPALSTDPRSLLFESYERISMTSLPQTDLLLPGEADMPIGSLMQQAWQQKLSAYINLRPLQPDEMAEVMQQGNFDMAILPATGVDASPYSILQGLGGRAGDNITGSTLTGFEELLTRALAASAPAQAARYYREAEELILGCYAAWPIYYQSSSFVSAPGVQGAYYLPQNGMIYFRDAQRF